MVQYLSCNTQLANRVSDPASAEVEGGAESAGFLTKRKQDL